jgi:5-methylthioadenosine/S-adenosylhomocysteine deaminase
MPNLNRLLMLGLCTCPLLAQTPSATFALRGTLVTPGGIVENGTVLIQQNKIVAVGAKVKVPANSTVIDTHAVIAPGLIDLHNHLTYNVFPRDLPDLDRVPA